MTTFGNHCRFNNLQKETISFWKLSSACISKLSPDVPLLDIFFSLLSLVSCSQTPCLSSIHLVKYKLLFSSEVYADPSHSAYEALRFVSGFTTTLTPGVCTGSFSFIRLPDLLLLLHFHAFVVQVHLNVFIEMNGSHYLYIILGWSQDHPVIHGRLSTRLETFF